MRNKPIEFKYSGKEHIKDAINSVWREINRKLEKDKNELFVFDFTFVIHRGRKTDIVSNYKYIHSQYSELLEEFLDHGQALLKTKNAININIYNQGGRGRKNRKSNIGRYESSFENAKQIHFHKWHEFLERKQYGGCSYVLFNRLSLGNDEDIELGIYCILKNPLEEELDETDKKILTKGSKTLSKELEKKLHRFLLITGQKHALEHYLKQAKKQAARAAISQVMARNMSHNIGSHVLSKFKDKNDFKHIDLKQYNGSQYNGLYKGGELRLKNQIAYFNDYLKNRMDFLADIATSDPIMENVMMLKGELIKGFDRNRILLNRISGVSDNAFQFRIDLTRNSEELKTDIPLSITNDVLGAQAFYIILENIIRNIAKHSKATDVEKKNIIITVDIKDFELNPSFYEISIFDNLPRDREKIEGRVVDRNNAFNRSILDEKTNNVRSTNLGTIEMDVCATYLRRLPIINVEDDDEEYQLKFCGGEAIDEKHEHSKGHKEKGEVINDPLNPKLIFAYKQPLNGKFSLGYKLFITKPKEVLVIDEDGTFSIDSVKNPDQLINYGILVVKNPSAEFKEDTVFNHQILYYHSGIRVSSEFNASLPRRIVVTIENAKFTTPEDFIRQLWEKYASVNFLKSNLDPIKIVSGKIELILQSKGEKIVLDESEKDSVRTIFVDNHNRFWFGKNVNQDYEKISEIYEGPEYFYYDMACGHTKITKYINSITSKNLDKNEKTALKSQYLEVVFCKIVIIDERIQENIVLNNKNYFGPGGKTNFYQYFKKQNIIIPTKKQADLNAISFGEIGDPKSIASSIKSFISPNCTQTISPDEREPDFYVVHLGILEKMMPSGSIKDRVQISNLIKRIFSTEMRKKLIITSGRGKPDNLPVDIPFVPFALIQNAVETVFDKFVLTKILFNARAAKQTTK